jgi:hypothetical protein
MQAFPPIYPNHEHRPASPFWAVFRLFWPAFEGERPGTDLTSYDSKSYLKQLLSAYGKLKYQ